MNKKARFKFPVAMTSLIQSILLSISLAFIMLWRYYLMARNDCPWYVVWLQAGVMLFIILASVNQFRQRNTFSGVLTILALVVALLIHNSLMHRVIKFGLLDYTKLIHDDLVSELRSEEVRINRNCLDGKFLKIANDFPAAENIAHYRIVGDNHIVFWSLSSEIGHSLQASMEYIPYGDLTIYYAPFGGFSIFNRGEDRQDQ